MHSRVRCSVQLSPVLPASVLPGAKVIHWMRHGQTEMNVHLGRNKTPSKDFLDPLLYDTRLTLEGREQARLASTGAKLLEPKPQVVITSPLTRALSTAQLAFAELTCPRTVEPLCSERLWLSSDVGRQPELLQQEFPQFYFGGLEDIWWHNDGSGNLQHVYAEPTDKFSHRMQRLAACISRRPEAVLAIVTHFSVLEHMTGHQFANGEIWSCTWRQGGCVIDMTGGADTSTD